jgi:hypothetical protein
VISIGLSIYELSGKTSSEDSSEEIEEGQIQVDEEEPCWNFVVHNFNILCENKEEYVREAQAFEFLVSHGFDLDLFNSQAIPYYSGNDVSVGTFHLRPFTLYDKSFISLSFVLCRETMNRAPYDPYSPRSFETKFRSWFITDFWTCSSCINSSTANCRTTSKRSWPT